MAEIKFYANINPEDLPNDGARIAHELGSGIGFYGSDYGVSVPVGSRQESTWITNSTGTATDARKLHNTKMLTEGDDTTVGTVSANGSTYNLNDLPNYLAPLNIRFNHTESVRVQNCKLLIFDRADVGEGAVDVDTFVYEIRHPRRTTETAGGNLTHRGISTSNKWTQFDGGETPSYMNFTGSPGVSGHSSNETDSTTGSATLWNDGDFIPSSPYADLHADTRHDWFIAISAEPNTIGSKTEYGLYFTLEYL